MIISHRHRFIFIHGPRTAGTSLTTALAPFCGPDDVVVLKRNDGLTKHDGSVRIREFVGPDVWQSYFKFTFERNPWDKVVSLYHLQTQPNHWKRDSVGRWTRLRNIIRARSVAKNPPSFRDWLLRKMRRPFGRGLPVYCGQIYFLEGDLAVDHVGRYEDLEREFAEITGRFGIDAALGGGSRRHRREADPDFDRDAAPYRKYYDDELREIVRRAYEFEIERFGYEF